MRITVYSILLIAFTHISSSAIAQTEKSINFEPKDSLISIDVGRATIKFSLPTGYVDTKSAAPELWKTLNAVEVGDTKVTAHYISIEDASNANLGSVSLNKFISVRYPIKNTMGIASQADFDQLRIGMANFLKRNQLLQDPRTREFLDRLSRNLDHEPKLNLKIGFEALVPVSIDSNLNDRFIYTQLASASEKQNAKSTLINYTQTVAILFIKGKVVTINEIRKLKKSTDISINRNHLFEIAETAIALNQ